MQVDMLHFFAWYVLLSLLGWLTFPLAWRLFPSLADRGFTLARALGLLVWGYLFWLLASLGVVYNDSGGIVLSLLVVIGLSLWISRKALFGQAAEMIQWLRSRKKYLISVEVIFLLAFAGWAFVRASNPNIETAGGEKTMELAFINAILRSPSFPPHDPWLSGYSISYYYFGYVLTAMLARVTATPGAVAHNLMLSLVFALSFLGAYGILYNLLEAYRLRRSGGEHKGSSRWLALLGPLFLLFVSNAAGFLEVLHRRGIAWSGQPGDQNLWTTLGRLAHRDLQAYNFWTWLDILHLNQPPIQPPAWIPDRFIWWWQDSRVIQDYSLSGTLTEIIDEFPAFSFMLGDLHPHVLAMPFVLLVLAFALDLFFGGEPGRTDLRLFSLPLSPLHCIFGALFLGGLGFLNTWDILVGFSLLAGAYLFARLRVAGWSWERLKELLFFSLPLGSMAFLLYLPFWLGFSSQAGGILPNLEYPSRGAHLWVMFGTLFLPLLVFLLHLWRRVKLPADWKAGLIIGGGFTLVLWMFSVVLGLLASLKMPDFVSGYLQAQGFFSTGLYLGAVTLRRLTFLGGLLTLLALIIPSLAFLWARYKPVRGEEEEQEGVLAQHPATHLPAPAPSPLPFVIFLILIGAVLVLAPEFIYLRDLFGSRMNTIFKFYYQAWLVWGLAAAFGTALLFIELRKAWRWVWGGIFALNLVVALAFPVLALPNKTADFQVPAFRATLQAARLAGDPSPLRTAFSVWSLDGARWFHQFYPDDAAASDWLASAPPGVIAEAVGGSYTGYARISTYSGASSVVGWIGHEDQWRGTFDEQRQRGERDIPLLYQSNVWEEAQAIIQKYAIRYIVVGTLERSTYRVYEINFQRYLVPVFQSGNVIIYQVP